MRRGRQYGAAHDPSSVTGVRRYGRRATSRAICMAYERPPAAPLNAWPDMTSGRWRTSARTRSEGSRSSIHDGGSVRERVAPTPLQGLAGIPPVVPRPKNATLGHRRCPAPGRRGGRGTRISSGLAARRSSRKPRVCRSSAAPRRGAAPATARKDRRSRSAGRSRNENRSIVLSPSSK